eukprot:1672546-Prymnesium_polylepis.1
MGGVESATPASASAQLVDQPMTGSPMTGQGAPSAAVQRRAGDRPTRHHGSWDDRSRAGLLHGINDPRAGAIRRNGQRLAL